MTEAALESATDLRASETGRSSALRRFMIGEAFFRWATFAAALAVLLLLGGVILSLIIGALPALSTFGLDFLTTQAWNPVTEKIRRGAPIYGTLVTSFIAMLIGIPVSLGIAIFLTELCPYWLVGRSAPRSSSRRHPLHHLRHLGPVRLRSLPQAP